jgi:Zn-dependent metalloprotease
MLRRTTAGAALCVGALLLTVIATGAAPAGAAGSSPSPLAASGVTVTADDPNGSARSVRTSPGHPLSRPSGLAASASSTTIATSVVRSLSAQLGTTGDTFAPKAVRRSSAGGDVVRLQQTVSGVPVLGGEVVVDLDPSGATRSVHSETLPSAAPSTTARVASSTAVTRALAAVVLSTKSRASDLRASTPTLAIYDPRIFGAPGVQRATLVWQTTVRSGTDRSIDHLVLVDATRGFVTLDLDQLGRGKVLEVCDADSTATEVPCGNPKPQEMFGTGDDLYKAWEGASATYDFYSGYLGRDSVDNNGLTLRSTVRYCPTATACPYQNAFWDGAEMVYGAGYPQADDVVAHELTHGVTQYGSRLFYYFQSGAINESLSDIFGEYVDQTDGIGTDTPQTAWQLGEDLPGGRIRDMADPTILIGGFQQPDRMGSQYYESHTNAGSDVGFDSGGVHGNSGVGNKLGYLLGSSPAVNLTFNGQTLTPLGIPKAARIIYDASLLLTSGADYRAFASALRSSCTALVGVTPLQSGTPVTQSDCDQVTKAILATEMDQVPANVAFADAPVCPTGTVPTTTFADGMENSSTGNWQRKGGSGLTWPGPPAGGGALWFYGSSGSNPYGIPQVYATGGTDNLWGDDPELSAGAGSVFTTHPSTYDGQIVSKPLTVPTGASYLRFEHAFGFDSEGSASTNHDGGRVEYTVNAGATWLDAGPLFSGNGYGFNTGGTASSRLAADNPLAGATAFTRHSQGYVASRISLASLAGKTAQFRFRITADGVVGDYGWFIDDVRLYSCGALVVPSTPSPVVFAATSITWPATDVPGSDVVTRYQQTAAKPGSVLPAYGALSAPLAGRSLSLPVVSGGGSTCVRVVAAQTSTSLTSSAVRCVSLPVDDRGLTRRGSWTQVRSTASYAATATISRTLGSTLTLASARGSHLVLVATRLVGGGSIGVYIKNKRVALVSLATTGSAKYRQLVDLHLSGLAGVPVVLRVETSGKYVSIDGVAVRP